MSDITKCRGEDCPKRLTCYRFTARPHTYRQSYAAFDHSPETKSGNCETYWPVEPAAAETSDLE